MKKIFSFLLAISISVSMLANVVTGTCGEHLNWSYDSDTYVLDITGYGAMSWVDRPWDQVASQIESVNLPSGLTNIYEGAFLDCRGLTSITLPNSVTSIGSNAFCNCDALTSITLPNSLTSIGSRAFAMCYALTSITLPNSVTSIGRQAFAWSGLQSMTIPYGVTSIEEKAFYNCSLTSITIPNSVTNIKDEAFAFCPLTSIVIPNSVTSIGDYAFEMCSALTSITIPNSVTSIGGAAFSMCSALTSITIPNSVTSIGDYAFWYCGEVYILGNIPASIGSTTFSPDANIYVPCAALDTYQEAEHWEFLHLIGNTSYQISFPGEYEGNVQRNEVDCSTNTIQIVAIPNTNYEFTQWSDGNTDNPRTLTLTSNTELTPVFKSSLCHVVLNGQKIYGEYYYLPTWDDRWYSDDFYNRSNMDFYIPSGYTITFGSDAGSCSEFLGWSDGVTDNYRSLTVTSDTTISAIYGGTTISIDITAAEHGYITRYGDFYEGGYHTTMSECDNWYIGNICAEAEDGYYFTGWSDGYMDACRYIDNPFYSENPQDINLVANFAQKQQVTVSLTSANPAMGSVSGSGTYYTGDLVIIKATPAEGYHFVEWSDGEVNARREEVIQKNITLTATFATGTYGGKCGPQLYWAYDKATAALTITGTGKLTYAGWQTFNEIHAKKLSLPNGLTRIEAQNAFNGQDLSQVVVPSSVEYIAYGAFFDNENLTRFDYQGDNLEIGTGEYGETGILRMQDDQHMTYARCPMNAFRDSWAPTDTLIISNGIITRSDVGFANPYNKYVDFRRGTFYKCYDYQFSEDDNLHTIFLPENMTTITKGMFLGCRHLESIAIPASVESIDERAFEDCRSMTNVTFEGTKVTEIGDWAFYNCHLLQDIVIPNGVETIGTSAFYGCSYLENITLPSSLREIGDNAFALCSRVQAMHVAAQLPPRIAARTFYEVDRSIDLYIPVGSRDQYEGDIYWQEFFNVQEEMITGIEATTSTAAPTKFLRDGQLLILRDGKTYNMQGAVVE